MTSVHTLVCIQGCAQKPGLADAITLRERPQALGIVFQDGQVLLHPLASCWLGRRGRPGLFIARLIELKMLSDLIQLLESGHGKCCGFLKGRTGALSPSPVEILFGPSPHQGAGVAFLDVFARDFEAFIEMPDAAFTGLIDLPPYFCGFPPIWGEMQLGPRLGPSCDPLFKLSFGH